MGAASLMLGELPAIEPAESAEAAPPAPRQGRQRPRVEAVQPGLFEVSGGDIERVVIMTDLDNEDAVRYLHRRLEQMGVIRRLRELGARDGDKVKIGEVQLDFVE
jgi:GTP-binding protein